MGGNHDASLLEEVYACDRCSAGAHGFARPSEGRPYYKFPPTIGARGQAPILFVGINPRRSESNAQLHREVMANPRSFEMFAGNKVPYHGRPRGPYIRSSGSERHYRLHVKLVEAVFGSGSRFEDHAAVTELFLCASEDSTGIQRAVAENRFPCADRYFARVLAQVKPLVVVAIGAPPARYLRQQRIGEAENTYRIRTGGHEVTVVELPHPNARVTTDKREAAFGRATKEIMRLRGEAARKQPHTTTSPASSSHEPPKRTPILNRPHNRPSAIASSRAEAPSARPDADGSGTGYDEPRHTQGTPDTPAPAPPGRQTDRSCTDPIAPKKFTVRIPLTGNVRITREAVENQRLRRPLTGGPGRLRRRPLARVCFRSAGIFVWLLGVWIMGRLLNAALVGLLLWWVWAGVVAAATGAARRVYLDRYMRLAAARSLFDDTPSDHYRAWHGRPHGGDPDESSHDTFVAYPVESHGAVAVQLLRYRPTVLFASTRIVGLTDYRGVRDPKGITAKSEGPGFAVTVIEQRSLPPDADTAEAAELKTTMDERAARDEADARLQRQRRQEKALEDEIAKEESQRQSAWAQSTAEALKHWRR